MCIAGSLDQSSVLSGSTAGVCRTPNYKDASDEEEYGQLVAALLFWRKQTISRYFAIWKKSFRRHRRQRLRISEHAENRASYSRKSLISHRSTDTSLRRSRSRVTTAPPSPPEGISKHIKPRDVMKKDTAADDYARRGHRFPTRYQHTGSTDYCRRRTFQACLKLMYVVFTRWRDAAREIQSHQSKLDQLAVHRHKSRCMQIVMSTWRHRVVQRHFRVQQWEAAIHFDDHICQKRHFMQWKWLWKLKGELHRRRYIVALRCARRCFCQWTEFAMIQQAIHTQLEKTQRKKLRGAIETLRSYTQRTKTHRLIWREAISHHSAFLRATTFTLWRKHVLLSPERSLSLQRAKMVALKTGIWRWSRFVQRRQMSAHRRLQADFARCQSLLKRAFGRWHQFRGMRQRRRETWLAAKRQRKTSLTQKAMQYWLRYRNERLQTKIHNEKAIRWHQTRVLASKLELWHSKARFSALAREFLSKRRAKHVITILVRWQDWVDRSRIRRRKYFSLQTQHKQNILAQAWSTWCEAQRRSIDLSSFLFLRQQILLKRHLLEWRSFVKSSVAHQRSVETMRAKARKQILQRTLNEWASTVMRRRCCRQLVKLFRKKMKRRRLHRLLQLLRTAVRCSRIQRRMESEIMRTAFMACRSFTVAQQTERAREQLALAYFCSRRSSIAVARWIAACQAQRRDRAATLTALKHYYDRILRRSLHCWYLLVRQRCRRAEMLASRKHQRDRCKLRSIMWTWYLFVQARRRRDLQYRKARRQCIDRRCREIWNAWLHFTSRRRYFRRLTRWAVEQHTSRCCLHVILSWRKAAKHRRNLNIRRQQVRRILTNRRILSAICTWRRNHRKQVMARRQLTMAKAFYRETLLVRSIFMWQVFSSSRELKRNQLSTASSVLAWRRVRSTVKLWHQRSNITKSLLDTQKRADAHHCHVLSRRGIDRWRYNRICQKQKRQMSLIATSHYRRHALCQLFELWSQYASHQHAIRVQLQQSVRVDEQSTLRHAFRRWRRYRRSSTLRRSADAFRSRSLRRRVWRRWVGYCRFMTKMNKGALIASRLFRENTLRTTFAAWQMHRALRWRQHEHSETAEVHFHVYHCRRAVRYWKSFCHSSQLEKNACKLALVQGKRHFFLRWQRCIHRMGEKERQWSHSVEWRRRKVLSSSWSQWVRTARRLLHERVSLSDKHLHKVVVKRSWDSWRRFIEWSKYAAVLQSRRKTASTRRVWNHWISFQTARAERKRLLSKSLAFSRLKQRTRAWTAWLRYLEYRHLRYFQYEQAQQCYAMLILRQKYLYAWARFASSAQDSKKRLVLAVEHADRSRLESALRRWLLHWRHRKTQKQLGRENQRRFAKFLLSRSVAKWMIETRNTIKQREIQRLGTNHHWHRCMATAVRALRQWHEGEKLARRKLLQALAFLQTQILVRLFRRWRDYLSWRKRNQRLIQLFRQSRKDDYFYRWKAYWFGKTITAAQTLKARALYCTNHERRSFRHWVEYACARRQKARADVFYFRQFQRRLLHQWRHRAGVIRQLRTLLRSQASFLLKSHFTAWQRLSCARKHQNQRFERATSFMKKSRIEKSWGKWTAYMRHQRAERAVVMKAERFRYQLLTWRLFQTWRSRTYYWTRKRVLGEASVQLSRERLLTRTWNALSTWHHRRRALRSRQERFTAAVRRKHLDGAISKLLCLVHTQRATKSMCMRADCLWKQRTCATYWCRWRNWHHRVKARRAQVALADSHYRRKLLFRYSTAMNCWFHRSKATYIRLGAFRRQFSTILTGRCFQRWRSTAVLRRELRRMVRRSEARRRLTLFTLWRYNAANAVRRRGQREAADAHFRCRLLSRSFLRWESVSTDLWTAQRLAQLQASEQSRRLASRGVAQWRRVARERRHARLAMVLRAWQRLTIGHSTSTWSE